MPDDRFEDLGAPRSEAGAQAAGAEPEPGSAAERMAREDERQARTERATDPPLTSSPYAVVVAVIFVALVVVAVVSSFGAGGGGAGIRGPAPGSRLAPFADPLATGGLGGDANVNPGPGRAEGAPPACTVRGPGVLNLCDARRDPLVFVFIVLRQTGCEPQLDVVERVRREVPGVRFAAVVSGESRESMAAEVRRRGWRFPLAVDPDGAVVNLNGIAVCPTTTFALPGGRVRETRIGLLSEAELRASALALRRDAR